MWTSHKDTNYDGSLPTTSKNLKDCMAACVDDEKCSGFDWKPFIEMGPCWLCGPWNGRKNSGTKSGVTHYDLDRKCLGMAIIDQPAVTNFDQLTLRRCN